MVTDLFPLPDTWSSKPTGAELLEEHSGAESCGHDVPHP